MPVEVKPATAQAPLRVRLAWFVALWLGGVAALTVLAMLIKLMIGT